VTLVRSAVEPLPNCTPAVQGQPQPIIWDITAAVLKVCGPTTNTWTTVTGGGSGGVTTFSAGNLSPLFTATVANASTTPALSFTLTSASADTVFANCTASPATPSFCALTAAMLPSTAVTSVVNDTNVTGSITAQALTLGWTGTLAKGRTLATTVYTDQSNAYSGGLQDFTNASVTVPNSAGAAPTTSGQLAYDTTLNRFVVGISGVTQVLPWVTSGVPTVGQCAVWASTSGQQTSTACGTGSTNNASQYSLPYYSAAGTANTLSGLAAPTGPSGLPYVAISTPNGSGATAPTFTKSGVIPRYVTLASDTIGTNDRSGFVQYTNATGVAVTIPPPSTTYFDGGFYFCAENRGAGPVSFTSSAQINGASGAIPYVLAQNVSACFDSDNTNWITKDSVAGGTVNDLNVLGPNPWYDLRRYGLYSGSGVPITCTTTATSASVPCTSVGDFAVGQGIAIPTAGIASTFLPWGTASITAYARASNVATLSTNGFLFGAGQTITITGMSDTSFNGTYTVTNNSGFTGQMTMPNTGANTSGTSAGTATLTSAQVTVLPGGILNGTTTYAYQVVLVGYHGELSAASNAGTTATGAATLGVNTVNVSTCTRTAGVATCTTTGAHNFQSFVLTDIEGTSNPSFNGVHQITSTPSGTTFTFLQTSAGASSATGGTAKVVAKNLVRWPMHEYNASGQYTTMQAIIYRSKNGGTYAVAGVTEGMDGSWTDWGLGTPIVPSYVPATPPVSATNGILATTITNISGTTLTLATPAVAAASSVASAHDNAPVVIAGCTALGTNGNGTLYIPTTNPPVNVPFNSPTDLYHSCPVDQVVIETGSTLNINAPFILRHAGTTIRGYSPSGAVPTFGIGNTTAVSGNAYPYFYVLPGSFGPNTLENLNTTPNQAYQSALVTDSDAGGGAVVNLQLTNFYGAGGSGSMPVIIKGGFNFFFDKGSFSSNGVWGVPEAVQFTVGNSLGICPNCQVLPYIIGMNRVAFQGHGMEWDDWGLNIPTVGGYLTVNDSLAESMYTPMMTLLLQGTGSVLTQVQFNRTLYADFLSGPATPFFLMGNGNVNGFISNSSYCGNGNQPLVEGGTIAVQVTQGYADGCPLIGATSYSVTNLQGSTGSFTQNVNFPIQASGTTTLYYAMNTPSAAPTLALGSGGLVPVGTPCYAVTASDINGGETVIGPSACVTTTSGNQTVTITQPTLPFNAVAWTPYWNNGSGSVNNRVPCSSIPIGTTTYVQNAAAGCGQTIPSFTTAGLASLGSAGLSAGQGTFNQIDLILQPSIVAPLAGFGRLGINLGTSQLTCTLNSGASCMPGGTTTGFTNVLSYAPGITINDGSTHTVSTAPVGSIFYGVTTLAGIAAISLNGATPFSWITSTPFNSAGVYNLTNSSVASLDIAWLAIEASLQSGRTIVPAGTYLIGTALNLPLLVPTSGENAAITGTPFIIKGDGKRASIIKAGKDFGSGIPLVSCGDPNGTAGNGLGRYGAQCAGDIQTIGLFSSDFATNAVPGPGGATVAMDGLWKGSRMNTLDVEVSGFKHSWNLVGDHTSDIRPRSVGGYTAQYWATPIPSDIGNFDFYDVLFQEQAFANIEVAPGATISQATYAGTTYLGSAPYAIIGDAATGGGCTDILANSTFQDFNPEFTGNSYITDDSNYSAGTYTDANKCRNVTQTVISNWWSLNSNSYFLGGGRARRAAIDVNYLGLKIDNLTLNGGNFSPHNTTAAPSGGSPIATINVTGAADTTGYVSAVTGNIGGWITESSTLPLLVGSASLNGSAFAIKQPGVMDGYILQWGASGTYSTTTAGDVFEQSSAFSITPGGASNGARNVFGAVLQSGLTTSAAVPVATSGAYLIFNVGWQTPSYGAVYQAGTGVGRLITIVAGVGGTNGTFTGTGTGGGCSTEPSYQFVVAGGAITSASYISPNYYGAGCTSAPTLSTSASSGATGTLTAQWPSAIAVPGTLSSTQLLGTSINITSPGNGANTVQVRVH